MTTPTLQSVLSKLPPEALQFLDESERALIAKETTNLDDLIPEDMSLQDAALLGLRIFSLLAAVEVEETHTWSSELESLSFHEDKSLIGLIKKLLKLDCFKLRKTKKSAPEEAASSTEEEDDCPLV